MSQKEAAPGWRRWSRRLVVPAVLVAAYYAVRDRLPGPSAVWAVITAVEPGWIAVAVAAHLASMTMFARQQSWLLEGVGVRVALHRALAVAYSRSAIAISMPAGTALSAAFAFRSYRRWGATGEAATAVMVLSGLCSFAGLALLWLLGFLVTFGSRPGPGWVADPLGAAVALVAVTAMAAFAVWRLVSRRAPGAPSPAPPSPQAAAARRGNGRVALAVRRAGRTMRGTLAVAGRMDPRYRLGALGFSVVNWLADIFCLVAMTRAVQLPLPLLTLGAIYVVGQIVRQIPLTPGGMGVIEASLLTGLVAAGAGQAPAAVAVMGYRLLTCWLIIPVGLLLWMWLRHADRPRSGRPDPRPASIIIDGGR